MEGHIVRLPEFIDLAKEYDAFVIVDDAHGFGVLGRDGRGVCSHFGLTDEVDVICSSFSKSLSGSGGFVAASQDAINYMRSHSKQTIFSAAISPVACACARAALTVIKEEPEHQIRLSQNLERYRKILEELNLDIWESETPAIPIVLGEKEKVYYFWKALLDKGIYINFNCTGSATWEGSYPHCNLHFHTDEDLDRIEEAMHFAKSRFKNSSGI